MSLYLFGNKGLVDRLSLESEKNKLEKSLKEEQQRTEKLQKELNDIKTSDYKLESVAREKYGLTKEGEKIYKVLADTTKNNE
ncbi:MAG TPA: septum formation initiator family protein [Ignavibacteria bacterium]|nr:septum formation initiator family protein [Ignavibacteria bacterium]